jgi:hypothetical protein
MIALNIPDPVWARWLGFAGIVLFVVCLVWTFMAGIPPATSAACRTNLKAQIDAPADKDAEGGKLEVKGVWPTEVGIGSQLCVVVAGVASKASETQVTPGTEANPSRPTTDVTLFLNDVRTPLVFKANAISGPQLLIYPFGEHDSATSDAAKFWRGLIAGKTTDGAIQMSVGASKSQSSSPEAVGPSIKFQVYLFWIVVVGAASMVCLVAAFAIYAANSTVLRDTPTRSRQLNPGKYDAAVAQAKKAVNNANFALKASPKDPALQNNAAAAQTALAEARAEGDRPVGTFSLGRTQMALWLGLSTAGFIFLWLTLGFYLNVITPAILVLLGINGVTGLASLLMDKPKDPNNPPPPAESKSFLADITCDAGGPQLQRVQIIIWTCILATIFIWNAMRNFVFVDFDTNLLLLMGIASSTYLGFKTQEKTA